MALKIMPHGRLQEWVAEEKGYFAAEGLEYSFVISEDYGVHGPRRDAAGQIKTGAFETFGAGRDGADVSCACHWATSAAASERAGQLVTTAYSVAPCAIVVPPESPVRRPEELAGVPIGVGYHSGSHFATLQALEPVLAPDEHYHLRAVPESYRDQVDVRDRGAYRVPAVHAGSLRRDPALDRGPPALPRPAGVAARV